MNEDALERTVAQLQGAKGLRNGYQALCPAHDDHNPSLWMTQTACGCLVLHCFAGCAAEAIVAKLDLGLADLFCAKHRIHKASVEKEPVMSPLGDARVHAQPKGCTLEQYAQAKRLWPLFLRKLGLRDARSGRAAAVVIPYRDAQGNLVATRFRCALEGPHRFRWKRGSRPLLYGLDRLEQARTAGYVALVEGESDTHTLWFHDVPAVGVPGATSWREEWAASLDGIGTIYVFLEPDQGGEAVAGWLERSAIRDRVRLVRLADAKDVSELYTRDPEAFRAAWQAALDAAVQWQDVEQQRQAAAREAAWDRCAVLAQDPDILSRVAAVVRQRGVVGEDRIVKLAYLALTSRLLDEIVSLAVKGPSSAGKSFVIEQVLKIVPPSAYYKLTAMSERALAYSEEPIAHRVLVFFEAAGIRGEFSSYLLRSLLSEGCLRYDTVEKTKDGLRVRSIERKGPTGLVVTTTAVSLHPENETRLISVVATDTPEQTRAVMRARAEPTPNVDVAEFLALQRWLETGSANVEVPFGGRLADMIPPVAVRLRRDFGALLALIRAHALLHQATRQRDSVGRILATVDDYRGVRHLISDLIASGVGAAVPDTIRETVRAVDTVIQQGVAEASVKAVAVILRLDPSAASRRVRAAVQSGYLRNVEDRRGRPARVVLGDPMPEEQELLPSPERLLEACTRAAAGEGIGDPPAPTDEQVVRVVEQVDCASPGWAWPKIGDECPFVGGYAAPPAELTPEVRARLRWRDTPAGASAAAPGGWTWPASASANVSHPLEDAPDDK